MPNIKVMHFGLGPIGAAIVKQVAARPGFKIVGAIVFTVGALAVAGVIALFVTCFAAVANIR